MIHMKVNCGICGKELVVDDGLADGQHIRCPHCNGTSEYHRPTRIDLPADAGRRRQNAGAPVRANPDEFEEIRIKRPVGIPPQERPALRVIRKEADVSAGQSEAEQKMVSRRLHMAEEHVKFYEEMKDRDRRRKMRERIQGVLLAILAVLCAVGVYWYIGYRKEKRQAAEIAYAQEKNRLEVERVENERREKELKAAAEKAATEKRLAEEKRQREERQLAQKREREERARIENELLENRVLYKKTCTLFAEGRFDFLNVLPTNALPGRVSGTFYYLLPFLDNGEVVVCQSSTNGIESVCRLDAGGVKTPFPAETFLASLEGKDYLLAHEDRVYFRSKRKKPHVAQLSKQEAVDLSKAFFGDVDPEVKRLNIDPEELSFEIVFVPKDSKKIIIADTLVYGVEYSLAKVREAIEDAYPMRRTSVTSVKKPKFKRTVVFWNGAQIKKGIDGTMYVPKVAPRVFPYWYRRERGWTSGQFDRYWRQSGSGDLNTYWQSLYNEAKQQELDEKRYYADHENAVEERKQAALSRAEQAYQAKIDRIYNEGTLYFRAKISK